MEPPITQEEIDKRADKDTRIRYINDLMSQFAGIDDKAVKLTIFKSLLGDTIGNPEVISYLQDYIDELIAAKNKAKETKRRDSKNSDTTTDTESTETSDDMNLPPLEEMQKEEAKEALVETAELIEDEEDDSYLPSFDELGIDEE